jgi:Flp pilus assembly protein TadG
MRRLADDRGAVSVVFGLVLMGVFLPLMLVVGDYGRVVVEKRQLQNSADAAAYAVAFDCARSLAVATVFCNDGSAQHYANVNDSHDGNTKVQSAVIDQPNGKATITTRSREATTDSIGLWVSGFFDSDKGRAQVDAEATAAWGGAATSRGFPLIMNRCLYDKFRTVPLLTPAQAALLPEATAPTIVTNEAYAGCSEFHPSGSQGWISPTTLPCSIQLSIGLRQLDTATGNATSCGYPGGAGAQADLLKTDLYRKVVQIPIASSHTGGGSGGVYRIDGWAALYVTGWKFDGGGQFQWQSNNCAPATGSARCIRGYFVNVPPTNGAVGGPSLGVQTVQLIK